MNSLISKMKGFGKVSFLQQNKVHQKPSVKQVTWNSSGWTEWVSLTSRDPRPHVWAQKSLTGTGWRVSSHLRQVKEESLWELQSLWAWCCPTRTRWAGWCAATCKSCHSALRPPLGHEKGYYLISSSKSYVNMSCGWPNVKSYQKENSGRRISNLAKLMKYKATTANPLSTWLPYTFL